MCSQHFESIEILWRQGMLLSTRTRKFWRFPPCENISQVSDVNHLLTGDAACAVSSYAVSGPFSRRPPDPLAQPPPARLLLAAFENNAIVPSFHRRHVVEVTFVIPFVFIETGHLKARYCTYGNSTPIHRQPGEHP